MPKTYVMTQILSVLTLVMLNFQLVASVEAAQEKLPKGYVSLQKQVLCAYLLSKSKVRSWVPAVRVGSKYVSAATAVKDKNLDPKVRKKAKKIAKSSACEKLVSAANFKNIPNADEVFKDSENTAFRPKTVLGTPPLLTSVFALSEGDLSNTFWTSGAVSAIREGSPTAPQCSEFAGTASDGQSGGIGACKLAQDIGDSFTALIRGKSGSCYFRSILTAANLSSGGLALTAGTFPSGGIANLLNVPIGSTNRTIKLVSSEFTSDYLRIYSDSHNRSTGNLYQYDAWSCARLSPGSAPEVLRVRTGYVDSVGMTIMADKFKNAFIQAQFGVQGALRVSTSGTLEYDPSTERVISGTQVATLPYNILFKSEVRIQPSGVVLSKSFDQLSGITRKLAGAARTSGSSPADLRFLDGAIKYSIQSPSVVRLIQTATEFRDSYYAAAPSSSLLTSVDSISLDTDTFYASPPTLSLDLSEFSCASEADIVLTIDPTNSAIQAALISCVETGFVGNMCRNLTFTDAEDKFMLSCP